MDTALLEQIGLTKSEIQVYLALLELGLSSTGKIVDKAKVSSSKIYEILDRLMQKGLVSVILKDNVKHFEAAKPTRLMDYMQEQEEELFQKKQQLKDLLPKLELRQNLSKIKSQAKVFRGIKGGVTAFRQLLDNMTESDEWIAFTISFTNKRYFDAITKIHNERRKRKLKGRYLCSQSIRKDMLASDRQDEYTEMKFIDSESPAIVNVAGNITLLNLMGDEVTVFLIESDEVANSFREQFEQLWNQDSFIVRGLDAIQDLFDEMIKQGSCDFIGAKGYFVDYRSDYVKDWEKRAIKSGFKMRNVVDSGTKGHKITKFPFCETKFTLPKEFANLSVFWIMPTKVAISNWTEDEPIALILENPAIVKMYQSQFEVLWNKEN